MKLSMCLSMAAGLAAAVGSAQAQQTVYFTTGRQTQVLFNGAASNLGFSGGNLGGANTERWSAQAFTIPAGGASVGEIDVCGFVVAGSEFTNLYYRIWTRDANNSAPTPAQEVPGASGFVALPPAENVPAIDPSAVAGFENALYTRRMVLPTPISLPAGNYWLTVYGGDPVAVGGTANFAWFTGTQPDPVYHSPVNTPIFHGDATTPSFMWRSTNYTLSGFAQYNPTNVAVLNNPPWGPNPQNPNYIWNTAFRILSAPPAGACCSTSGVCTAASNSTACAQSGGSFKGPGSTCAGATPCNGACCLTDASCVSVTQSDCTAQGGVFNGVASTCATVSCGGRCCKPDGTCQVLSPADCTAADGIFGGLGTNCAAFTCPLPGACCMPDNTCQSKQAYQCARTDGSIYRGDGTTCPSTCLDTGACCQMTGVCSVSTASFCKSVNGLFRGAGSGCGAANCPTVYNYGGVSVAIPDAPSATQCGVVATAEVSVSDNFTIAGADVSIFASHTWQGDVKFWLKHVQTGTMVQVINQPPAGAGSFGEDNFGNFQVPGGFFRLLDNADNFYRTPAAPAGGIAGVHWQWKPEAPLNATTPAGFAGESSAGEWQLVAQDCGAQDIGVIETWSLALYRAGAVGNCYANCDNTTATPYLNVQDFTCFLQRFSAGNAYANCDSSTQAPTLNVQDFTCFLQKFSAGCSAP